MILVLNVFSSNNSFMPELNAEKLKKKAIFFGFEDVLVPGKVDKNIDLNEVKKILSNLQTLQNKFNLHVVVISGYSQKIGEKKLKEFSLEKFFNPDFVFFVSKNYLSSMQEIDRKRYEVAIKKDPNYKDEYFKQYVIQKFSKDHNISKKQMIYIGHDVWVEGFYTRRFSQIDFALIKSAYSQRGEKAQEPIKHLFYIQRKWKDIQKLLTLDELKAEYSQLDNYVTTVMKEKLFEGTKLEGLVNKSLKRNS
ncbi:MAG: hypothetical protein Q7S21_00300 [archaeon]|nr:hypothetical protein [archaeon]